MDLLDSSQRILVEHYEDDFEPTEEELLEYCNMLGLDPSAEQDLLFIAREGIRAPLPETWKPVEDKLGNIYYFNFKTGESIWEHPCDEFYKNLLVQERQKKATRSVKHGSKKRHNTVKKLQGRKAVGRSKGLTNGNLLAVQGKQHHMPPSRAIGKNELGPELNGSLSGRPLPQTPGGLPPLSLPTGHNVPLPGLGSLPKLKMMPRSLAPLQIPSETSSGLGDPFGRPIGNGSLALGGSLLTALNSSISGGPEKLGTVDLGAVNISNQYEEENSETQSEDESDPKFDEKFQSKFGVSFLDAKVLSIKESHSAEDVSRELRRVMDLDESNTAETSEEDDKSFKRPTLIPPHKPLVADKIHTPQTAPGELRPVTRGRSRGNAGGGGGGGGGKSEPPFQADQFHVPSAVSGSRLPLSTEVKPTSGGTGDSRPSKQREKVDSVQAREEVCSLKTKHDASLAEMQSSHELQLEKLRQRMDQELQAQEESLHHEKEMKMAELRMRLSSEQTAEEIELKEKKSLHLGALQAKLKEEEEEEEARQMEEKQDALRKIRNQVAAELEKEKKEIESFRQGNSASLRKNLDEEMKEEEDKAREALHEEMKEEEYKAREALQEELDQLRGKLKQDVEEKKKALDSANEKELEAMRRNGEEDQEKLMKDLRKTCKDEVDLLKSQLEAEHEKALKEARTETEKRFNTEEMKLKAEKSFKEAEVEMKEKFGAELDDKKSELGLQHETELDMLKEEFRRKLDQINKGAEHEMKAKQEKLLNDSRNVIILEHESRLQKLREDLEVIARQIEREKHDQDGVLEAMQSEHELNKAELVRKLAEHAQQVAGVEERMQRLRDEEGQLQTDEERLSQLRSANAQETEELLKGQASHLKSSVKTEKMTLEGLNKTRDALESELLKLRQYKSDLESSVQRLRQDESEHQLRVERLAEETKLCQSEASIQLNETIVDLSRSYQTTRLLRQTELGGPPSPPPQLLVTWPEEGDAGRGNAAWAKVRGGSVAVEGSLTASSEEDYKVQDHSTAMRLQDLEDEAHAKMSNLEELECARVRMDQRHREMHEALEEEKRSLEKRRAYFHEKERHLKKRQADYKQANMKSLGGRQQLCNDDNITLMTDIQGKLDQEGAALAELEKKVKASNDLLDRKERGLSQLQAIAGKETDAFRHLDVPPPPPSISPTAIEVQISKLSSAFSALEGNRMGSPLREVTFHRPPSFKTSQGEEYELTSSESDSSRTDAVRERHRPLSTTPPPPATSQATHLSTFRAESPMRIAVTEPWQQQQQQEYAWKEASRIHPPPNKIDHASTNSIMKTLVSINTQVAELMNQVRTSGASRTVGLCAGSQPVPFHPDSNAAPSVVEPVGVLPPTNTSMRWTDPLMPPKVDLPPEIKEMKFPPCNLGDHQSAVRMPFGVGSFSATARSSTEALIKRQTDWLKEFKQSVPHSSHLRPRRTVTFSPSTVAPPPPASISASSERVQESSELGHLKFTGKSKLILDNRDKIKLIHV